jgi:hypothetical protein
LKRDGGHCQLQYPGICIHRAVILEHIIPLAEGGADTDENTCAACVACAGRKSSLEGHRAKCNNVAPAPTPPARRPPQPALPVSRIPRSIQLSAG